jgi:putative restriction endonuclease
VPLRSGGRPHSPDNYIVGAGFVATSSLLPVSIAWETFRDMNGVASLMQMRERIEKYRRAPANPAEDYTVGNFVLEQAFFLRREAWIPVPADFSLKIVQGKTYDLTNGPIARHAPARPGRVPPAGDRRL